MSNQLPNRLVAIDVGNSRVKWGLFNDGQLAKVTSFPIDQSDQFDLQAVEWQLDDRVQWAIGSVNAEGARRMEEWLSAGGRSCKLFTDWRGLPLRVEVERPERVGIDRLLNAVAANARRPAGRPALVVDAGSAITVDAIAADGSFVGGTIAIGLALAGRALHEFTSQLPLVTVPAAPVPLGKSTIQAMQSGLFWGAVGTVKELLSRLSKLAGASPIIYISGGDGERLAEYLERPVHVVPHLTLEGIQISFEHDRRRGLPEST
jgi:type III pantothenate kinase